MATKPAGKSLARSEMNKVELATFEAILHSIAPLIDTLLADGVPYTKLILPQEIPPGVP